LGFKCLSWATTLISGFAPVVYSVGQPEEMNSKLKSQPMRGPTNPSRLLKVLLCLLAVASLAARGGAADSFPADGLAGARIVSFAATDMEVTDYADNSLEPDAVWKIKSVSPEHRRMGFFSVKLLPVMVVRDIQLNFTSPRPQT
jgi:hypothetical protein